MFDQVKPIYIRILTLVIFIAIPIAMWENSIESFDLISGSISENEAIENLKVKLDQFLSDKNKTKSPQTIKFDSSLNKSIKELNQPVDFITLNGEILKIVGGKIIQVEPKETILNSEKISIRFSIVFECTYSQWVHFRKIADQLPYKIIYHQCSSEKTLKNQLNFKEDLEFTKYL